MGTCPSDLLFSDRLLGNYIRYVLGGHLRGEVFLIITYPASDDYEPPGKYGGASSPLRSMTYLKPSSGHIDVQYCLPGTVLSNAKTWSIRLTRV